MDKENFIKTEAKEFIFSAGNGSKTDFEIHKNRSELIEDIKKQAKGYYDLEGRLIFLREIVKLSEYQLDIHLKGEGAIHAETDCKVCFFFQAIIFHINQEIETLPKILNKSNDTNNDKRYKVFISYSRKDKEWLEMLKRHFRPFKDIIDFWDDSNIKPGMKWKDEINQALEESKVAILLISADFFNSEFILNDELPKLLKAAETKGATILSVILKPCLFQEYPKISQFQAINSPTYTILEMDEVNREKTFVELVKQIKEMLN